MAKKFIVTGEQHFGIDGQMLEIKRQLRLKSGSPIDPALVTFALQDIVEGKFSERKANSILKFISKGESLLIDAVSGKETLAQAKDVFPSGIDPDFEKWGTDEASQATEETPAQVHEMVKDATFAQMFGSLGTDLDKLCFTQHQIKNFCKKHPNWLRADGYATFFLFKVKDQYSVAGVGVGGGGLFVNVHRLELGLVWNAEYLHRVVVPQLAA
ncbi:MAG: hypothetical protein Q8N57_01360 [bacterium]|nr:hypothetical protein [bacterium]